MTGNIRGGIPRRKHHDVVVVGARCAGASTALLLARAGHDVVMIDKSHPARDTNSTHALSRGGVVQLARWGLLDDVVASGAPEIRAVTFHHGGEAVRHTVRDRAGVDFLLAPRRFVLDALLAEAAVRAGAQLLTDTTVTGMLRGPDGRVEGVTVRDHDGTLRAMMARLVIGADGLSSAVAKQVGAAVVEDHVPTGSCFYTYVGGVPWDGFEFSIDDGVFAGAFPTHGGEACVWMIRPTADMQPVIRAGANRMSEWMAMMERTAPAVARKVRAGSVCAPLRGYVGLPNRLRRATGPGWALVGDAGYYRDPITGHGMTDAFRDAELLSDAADAVLRSARSEHEAMAHYEAERDAAIGEIFFLTRRLGAFPPRAEFIDLHSRYSTALELEALALAERPLQWAVATT
jgi:2-polyprenyl-6-methoxyphenol hydroxylase-like FAD-dependent oxidoreductase